MHASRPCVSRSVGFPICFRNRMSLVGCQVIPEIFEVGALAALNQGFRGWPVEPEMPYAGIVVNSLPTTNARKESIHEDEFRHFRRELRDVGVGDHETDAVSDDISS